MSTLNIQWNLNGSNIFGTMDICSTNGYLEPLTVNHNDRVGGRDNLGCFCDLL